MNRARVALVIPGFCPTEASAVPQPLKFSTGRLDNFWKRILELCDYKLQEIEAEEYENLMSCYVRFQPKALPTDNAQDFQISQLKHAERFLRHDLHDFDAFRNLATAIQNLSINPLRENFIHLRREVISFRLHVTEVLGAILTFEEEKVYKPRSRIRELAEYYQAFRHLDHPEVPQDISEDQYWHEERLAIAYESIKDFEKAIHHQLKAIEICDLLKTVPDCQWTKSVLGVNLRESRKHLGKLYLWSDDVQGAFEEFLGVLIKTKGRHRICSFILDILEDTKERNAEQSKKPCPGCGKEKDTEYCLCAQYERIEQLGHGNLDFQEASEPAPSS